MKTIDQINFKGKKALLRVDFNIPLDKDLKIIQQVKEEMTRFLMKLLL